MNPAQAANEIAKRYKKIQADIEHIRELKAEHLARRKNREKDDIIIQGHYTDMINEREDLLSELRHFGETV
jgi:predicted transcriptional regulator